MPREGHYTTKQITSMLWLIIIILIVGWLLGFFVFNLGSLLHILLVVAVVILIVNLLRGRPAV